MKTFSIITEADARLLERGSTVTLAPGGHITPLAHDTLRERHVTVIGAALDDDIGRLAPAAEVRRLAIGADHTGVALKDHLRAWLRQRGIAVTDVGTDGPEAVDYPDIAVGVARLVARGEADAGIVIDGAGLGSAIAANKVDGVRAAMCPTRTLARYAREHNGAHVLALGSTLVTRDEAEAIVETFLATPCVEPRYLRRLAKVRQIERTR